MVPRWLVLGSEGIHVNKQPITSNKFEIKKKTCQFQNCLIVYKNLKNHLILHVS